MGKSTIEDISKAIVKLKHSEVSSALFSHYPIEDLIKYSCQNQDKQLAFRSAWIVETIVLKEPAYLTSHQHILVDAYLQTGNWSCLRSYSKIIMWLLYPKHGHVSHLAQKEAILEKTFNCLLDTKCPIAVKVNCFDILYYLRNEEGWIREELIAHVHICLLDSPTPASKSRGERILKKLKGET